MLRSVILAAVVIAIVLLALGPRALYPRSLKRALYLLAAIAAAYTVLKLTGVIDAIAPDRTGVF